MLKFIGEIRTPYKTLQECPKFTDEQGPACQIVVDKEYEQGLFGLEAGNKILVLYWFTTVFNGEFIQKRRGNGAERGVFALRSPLRPNPIAASIVTIDSIEGNIINVHGFDCLDGTKLLDIKIEHSAEETKQSLEEDKKYQEK